MQTAPPRCSKWWWQNGESLPNQSPWQGQSKWQSRRKRPSKTRKKRFLLWHQEGSQWPRWPCWPGISWYHFKKQSPKVHVWPCFACMLFRMASSGVYNQTLLYLIQYLHIEQKREKCAPSAPISTVLEATSAERPILFEASGWQRQCNIMQQSRFYKILTCLARIQNLLRSVTLAWCETWVTFSAREKWICFRPQSGPELEPRFGWKPLCMTFLTDIFWGLWSHIILSDFDVWLWFLQNAKQSKVVLLNTEKLLDQDIVAARAAWVMLSCSKARASTSFWWPGCASATIACKRRKWFSLAVLIQMACITSFCWLSGGDAWH